MTTFMVLHVMSHMLMMMLDVTAMLHLMDVMMLFGVGMLNMMQFSFAMMFCTAAIQMSVVRGMVMMFHGSLLISCGGFYHHVSCPMVS
jgi:hypothetical protein